MASKSHEQTHTTVRLLIFSGRADPELVLEDGEEGKLSERLAQAIEGEPVHPPPEGGLGYRGFHVRLHQHEAKGPDEFSVFRGVVTQHRGRRVVHWRDIGDIEELLLAEARRQGWGEILDQLKEVEE